MSVNINFNIYEIDEEIKKNKKYEKNENIFSLFHELNNITEFKGDNKPKYFAKLIEQKGKQIYIGVLTDSLKRDKYGYIRFKNGDEYLGEIVGEKKNGIGIYRIQKENNSYELYIGELKNDERQGEGILLNYFDPNQYNCNIGLFEKEEYKGQRIFNKENGKERLFIGKINSRGIPLNQEAYIIEGKSVTKGTFKDGVLCEGIMIFLKESQITKRYFFERNKNNEYDFNILKGKEEDQKLIEYFNNSNYKKMNNNIMEMIKEIDNLLNDFQIYDKSININFEDIKKKLSSYIDLLNNNNNKKE